MNKIFEIVLSQVLVSAKSYKFHRLVLFQTHKDLKKSNDKGSVKKLGDRKTLRKEEKKKQGYQKRNDFFRLSKKGSFISTILYGANIFVLKRCILIFYLFCDKLFCAVFFSSKVLILHKKL